MIEGDGAPEKIRTSDLQLRRLPLYPAELRARLERTESADFKIPDGLARRERLAESGPVVLKRGGAVA